MNKRILSSIIICLFMLTCIASVSAADMNASDSIICLDDDFNDLSTILEDSSPDFSLSKENSPIGGGTQGMLIPQVQTIHNHLIYSNPMIQAQAVQVQMVLDQRNLFLLTTPISTLILINKVSFHMMQRQIQILYLVICQTGTLNQTYL